MIVPRPIAPAPVSRHHHHSSSSSSSSSDSFRTGDVVYIHKAACRGRMPWGELGAGRTDDSLFVGPFRIIARLGQGMYQLDLPRGCAVKNCFEERILKRAERYSSSSSSSSHASSSASSKSKYKQAPVGQAYQMDRAHEIVRLVEVNRSLIRPRYRAQWKGCDPKDTTVITENVLLQLPRDRRHALLRDLEARS